MTCTCFPFEGFFTCETCGALVEARRAEDHDRFHGASKATITANHLTVVEQGDLDLIAAKLYARFGSRAKREAALVEPAEETQ